MLLHSGQMNNANRQLTIMICMQVILVVISVAPFGAYNSYALATANQVKDADEKGKALLAATITNFAAFLNYGVSKFLFCLAHLYFTILYSLVSMYFWLRPVVFVNNLKKLFVSGVNNQIVKWRRRT